MVYEVTKQQFLFWVVFATYFRTHKRRVQNLREWTNQDSYGSGRGQEQARQKFPSMRKSRLQNSSRAEKRLRMCYVMRQKTQAQARANSKWLQFRGK